MKRWKDKVKKREKQEGNREWEGEKSEQQREIFKSAEECELRQKEREKYRL